MKGADWEVGSLSIVPAGDASRCLAGVCEVRRRIREPSEEVRAGGWSVLLCACARRKRLEGGKSELGSWLSLERGRADVFAISFSMRLNFRLVVSRE